MTERLQKFIARSTSYSRRKAEDMITAGKVKVNGVVITKLGTIIDSGLDQIMVRNKLIQPLRSFQYLMVNKPIGYTCTRAKGEKTVYDLVANSRDLVIAGRLDKGTEGLVLLTNDGELVQQLTHPRFEHEKEYQVSTIKPLLDVNLDKLKRGVRLREGLAKADRIERVNVHTIKIVLHQGWNRQIRRMLAKMKHDIKNLKRIRIGKLELGQLDSGRSQKVNRSEIV
ncbi:MAG: pseudouridine synthase [bacterium]